jgi:hypothetical protein
MTSFLSGGCVRVVAAAAAFAAVVGASSIASAVGFSGSYEIHAHNSGNGLLIETKELADPLNFVLTNPGDMYKVDLFRIWTNETDVGGDDKTPRTISVDFDFTAPPSAGSVLGTTVGGSIVIAEWGEVKWTGPEIIDFGNGGKLQVSLKDEKFNGGLFGLTHGEEHGKNIEAKFTLISDSTREIPLPASLPLLMAALGGLTLVRRRTGGEA